MPLHLEKISEHALEGCTGLTELQIPDSVLTIRRGAFWGCSGLAEVTLPTHIARQGNDLFQGCTSLYRITLNHASRENMEQAFLATSKFEDKILLAVGMLNQGVHSEMLEEYVRQHVRKALYLFADQFNDAMFAKTLGFPFVQREVKDSYDALFRHANQSNNMKIKAVLLQYRNDHLGYQNEDEFEL